MWFARNCGHDAFPVSCLLIVLLVGCADVGASTERLRYVQHSLLVENVQRQVTVPEGYRLEVLTDELGGPRLLTFAPNGELLIGSTSGRVFRLSPPYRRAEVLLRLNDYPHSVALRAGELLIAQNKGLYRVAYEPGQESVDPEAVRLLAKLPGGQGHSSRSVGVGPDGRVYLSLGISGNCSNEFLADGYDPDERRGGVIALSEAENPSTWHTFASGLRNPVGFDWHPDTGVLYASNNGPDQWGYELPPEYFSKLLPGSFHGMPWFQFNGARMQRDKCIKAAAPRSRAQATTPVATFPARSAPMGVAFITDDAMEPALVGDAVVALHGSWATRPDGGFFGDASTRRPPKLVAVRFENGEARRVDDLVTGFQLENGDRWARPVGVAVGPDGAVYFTSDQGANALFRLRRVAD